MALNGEPPPEGRASGELEHVVLWARVSPPSGAEAPRGRRSRPPRSESTYSLSGAIRALEARIRAGGGAVEAQLSGQLVASFGAAEAVDAIELGLELLDEADGYDLAIALSISPTWRDAGVRVGSAFDDSFFLAARAKPGELLVDGALRDRVPGTYLFTRQVSQGGVRAGSIDRRHPRRGECVQHLAALGHPPLVTSMRGLVGPLVTAMSAPDALVLLEGPLGAGAVELVDAAHREAGSPPRLWLGGAAGALSTLESLARALAGSPARSDAQKRLIAGEILPLADAAAVVLDVLGDGPAWIVLNPFASIDVASLEVIAAARARRPGRLAIVARAPHDTQIPSFLGEASSRSILPALRTSDAREVLRTVLGAATTDDVVRRVATMGGDTTLGCEEAARLLVASGDLVREEDAFVWRTTPRGGVEGVGVEELARGRLELLSEDARRVLELVSVLPRGASRDVLRDVAAKDGLHARAVAHALTVLASEAWLTPRDEPSAHFVRRVVQTAMPPARLAELHRFCAEALAHDAAHRHAVAHFALEGGRDAEARAEARRIGDALSQAGFVHASARFTGAPSSAVSVSPAAARPVEAIAPPPPDAEAPSRLSPPTAPYSALAPSSPGTALATTETPLEDADETVAGPDPRELRRALRERDVAAIERWVERSTLAGADLASIARLRAVIDLLRGDFANAEARIARGGEQAAPKAMLAQAMVALGAGRSADAVRLALRALSVSLRRGDARGRSAAYHALAACYRAEGRAGDAEQLAGRAQSA